jgi:hypothetical protein
MADRDTIDEQMASPGAFIAVFRKDDGSTKFIDRKTGAEVISYADLIVREPDGSGRTANIDKYTRETIINYDGFVVEYINPDGSIKIIDRATGNTVEEYNEYFIEYRCGNSGTRVVDRRTGETAMDCEENIVYFRRGLGGPLMVDRDTGEEIDPSTIDAETTVATGFLTFKEPVWVDVHKAEVAAGGVRTALWTPRRKLPEEDEPDRLFVACGKQIALLQKVMNNQELTETEHRLKWWVWDNTEEAFMFRPKRGPNIPVWLKREGEACDTYGHVEARIIAFRELVKAVDYYEPRDINEDDATYLIARLEKQIDWLKHPPDDKHSIKIMNKLKWWEYDENTSEYRFMPKVGSKRDVWPAGSYERYLTKDKLIQGIEMFITRVRSGVYKTPRN